MRERHRARESQQGNLYLITGLILGLGLGLLFAWVISPVQYTDTEPRSLSPAYQDEYRRIIALAYAADHDLSRARGRLGLLSAASPSQALASQAQRMKAENQPPEDVRALALLASDLLKPTGEAAGATEVVNATEATSGTEVAAATIIATEGTPTAEVPPTATLDAGAAIQTPTAPLPTPTPTVTRTPQPTFTPRPTATPARVLNAPFGVKSKTQVCDGSIRPGTLQVLVTDSSGKPLPGVKVFITWKDGEDTFYTGLAPEINPGYADYVMAPGVVYNLKVGEVSEAVNGISVKDQCAWKFEFAESQ